MTNLPKGPTGICQGCGGTYALRSDGLIRSHREEDRLSPCPGGAKRPQEELVSRGR
jgi:hypothetical protein